MQKDFPILVNGYREDELLRVSALFVSRFESEIYPTLCRFGLLDDAHIQKYLSCDTMEEIYNDAMTENREKMLYLEIGSLYGDGEEDIWKAIRSSLSPVKSPQEDGFIFADLPCMDYTHIDILRKSFSVNNCKISVDKELFKKASIIKPTDKQRELYALLVDFCTELEKKNYQKRGLYALFTVSKSGTLLPNARGVIGQQVIYCYEIEQKK